VGRPRAIHYAGALEWRYRRHGVAIVYAGWAACCAGRRADAIKAAGLNTYEPAEVTCAACKYRLALAAQYATEKRAATDSSRAAARREDDDG
jgi:hypothetical protein